VAVLVEHRGKRPTISSSAYVAPNAVLCGDVVIGDDARVLFGAVITAEGGQVVTGERCIVMEHALVRGRAGHPTRLGNDVLVGPHAHVNGAEVGDATFLATGASVFPGARIGSRARVRINGVVHVNSALPPATVVPIGWIALGDPAQLFSPDRHDEYEPILRELDFVGTVFGTTLERWEAHGAGAVAPRYVELFGEHLEDSVLGRCAHADRARPSDADPGGFPT
jgi:carbonic anhydrase/acetyltransferase-like protein (isoleucine patch superfamily)